MEALDVIKKIRELTGAGVVEIKRALEQAGNDEAKAIDILRLQGQKIADKKNSREIKEGLVDTYVHSNGKVAALVAVACETDFVVRNADFRDFVHNVALQVVAANPKYLNPEDVPADIITKEKEIYRQQLVKEGKPEAMIEKIVTGKLDKFYREVCLLKQTYIKDDSKTIEQLLTELIAKIGENIKIVKFVYFSL